MSIKILFEKLSEPSAAIVALVVIATTAFLSLKSNDIAVSALGTANESMAQVRQIREDLKNCDKDKQELKDKLNQCLKNKK